ncbi:hypothetical protein ACFV3E_41415 [Streptomyces sp. NPDC059718]
MVQAVENLTALTTRLLATAPHPRLKGWDRAVVDVLHAQRIAGFADVLSRHVGQRLELAVPSRLVAGLAPGTVIRLRPDSPGVKQWPRSSRPRVPS